MVEGETVVGLQTLSHLIQLNERYGVLICIGDGCCCAVSPAAISDHLRRKHQVQLELRKQVDRYIEGFPFTYGLWVAASI